MRIGECKKSTGGYEVHQECPFCGRRNIVKVTEKQLQDLKTANGYIQNILFDHSENDRESFLSGLCDECYSKL